MWTLSISPRSSSSHARAADAGQPPELGYRCGDDVVSVAVSILTDWDGRGLFLSRSACLYCQIRDLAARLPRSYDWRSIRVRQRASALAKACIF